MYDNKTIYVYEKGNGINNYIFLCGWANPTALSDMYELADEMSKYGRCIIIERFGYGESSNCKSKRNLKNISEEINVVLKTLNINDNIVLVGHSLGTFISIDYAKRNKEKIKAILLLDSYPIKYTYERFSFVFNYIIAFGILFFRKVGILKRMNNAKLEKVLFKNRNIPQDIKAQAVKITKEKIYNKTILNELKDSIQSLKYLFKDISMLNETPVTCICRSIYFKRNLLYKDYLKQVKVVKVDNLSHFIHHIHTDIVLNEIKNFK